MTAYAVPSDDPTAVLGRRAGAFIVDGFIALVLMLAIGIPVLLSTVDGTRFPSDATAANRCDQINGLNTRPSDGTLTDTPTTAPSDTRFCVPVGSTAYIIEARDVLGLYATVFLLSVGVQVLNLVLLQGLTGASIGKHLAGLRVIREDGSPAGIGWNLLRFLLLVVADNQCFIGIILVFATKGHRRVGDMAASTFVVRKADVGRPVVVPGLNAPGAWAPAGGYPGTPGHSGVPGYGGGYGGAAYPGPAWGAPAAAAAPVATTPRAVDGPQWDAARDTYIQYDRASGAWLQWSEVTKEWRPIDT